MEAEDEILPQDSRLDRIKRIVNTLVPLFQPLPGCGTRSMSFDRLRFGVDCDEVYTNLFVGDWRTARNKAYLEHLRITHVLNVAEGPGLQNTISTYEGTGIHYLGIAAQDNVTFQLSKYFHPTANFIGGGIERGGNVLVHCHYGISRSSTIAASYLMIKKGFTAAMALTVISQRRRVRPNDGFLEQLLTLEDDLHNRDC